MTCTPNNNFELYLRFADERGLGGACWPATSTFRSAVQKETQIGGQEVRSTLTTVWKVQLRSLTSKITPDLQP